MYDPLGILNDTAPPKGKQAVDPLGILKKNKSGGVSGKITTSTGSGQPSSEDIEGIKNYLGISTPKTTQPKITITQKPLQEVIKERPLSTKEVTNEAISRLEYPSLSDINRKSERMPGISDYNNDPIGNMIGKLETEKKVPTGDLFNEDNLSKINENLIRDKQMEVIKNNFFQNGFDAEEYAKQYGLNDNLTGNIARSLIDEKNKIVNTIQTTSDLTKAAVKYYTGNENEFQDNISKSEKAIYVDKFLNDPTVIELAKRNPNISQLYKETKFNFPNEFPGYTMSQINQKIAQKMEDKNETNWLYNNPGKEKVDKIVEEMVGDGELSEHDKYLYEKNTRPDLGTLKSFWYGSKIPTSGAVESFSEGIKTGMEMMGSSAKDVFNKFTGGLVSNKGGIFQQLGLIESNEDRTKRLREEQLTTPQIESNRFSSGAAQFLGFTTPMILGTMAGSPPYAVAIAQFEGQNADRSRELFKNNIGKQNLYTLLSTGIDAAFGELLPTKKAAQSVKGLIEKDILNVIEELSTNKITKDAAKNYLFNKVKNYAGSVLKENTKTGGIVTAFNFLHNTLDSAFGARNFNLEKEAQEAIKNYPSLWLNSSFLSMISSVGSIAKSANGGIIRKLADNPDAALYQIEKLAEINPQLAQLKEESIQNLKYAVDVNKELNNRSDLSEKQKNKFMILSINDKILNNKMESIPDKNLRGDIEKELKLNEIEKQRILNPDMGNKKFIEEMYDNELLPKSDMRMLENEKGKFNEHAVGDYLKYIAQQANNLDENWNPHITKAPDVSHIPEQVIEASNERWAKEIESAKSKQEELLREQPSRNISVILPEENIKPNIVEPIKPQTNGKETENAPQAEGQVLGTTQEGTETVPSLSESINEPKIQESALQISRPSGQVSLPIEGGKNISESSSGVRPGEQRNEITGKSEKESEITGEKEPPISEPPGRVSTGAYIEYPPTSLNYMGTGKLETEFGIEERTPTERKRDVYTIKEANDLIANGFDVRKKVNEVISENSSISDAEYIVMTKYAAELADRLRNTDKTSPEYDKILSELSRVANAANISGREGGRALGIRARFKTVADDSYGEFMLTELTANNDAPLTDNQKEIANKEFEKLEKARKELDENTKVFEEKIAAFRAEQELSKVNKKTNSKTKKRSHEDFVTERKSFKEELIAARKEHEDWLKEQHIKKAGFGSFTTKEAIIIGKYVKSYAEETALTLKEIAEKVIEEVKDIFPGISHKDIVDIVAGEYNERKITKTQAAIRMEDLRIEAQLLNKYERLLKGEEPKKEKAKRKRNQEIEELRKKIIELKKEEKESNIFYKEEKPEELKKIERLQKKNELETKKIKELIDKGDFSIPEKKTPLMEDKELQKRFPDQFAKTQKSLDEYLETKRQITVRRLKQMYENKSSQEKAIEVFSKSLNVPRTLMASFDFSAPLRQGIVATAAHPQLASKALKFMFEAAKDEKVYNRWLNEVHKNPRWYVAEKTGLGITDPESLHVKQSEEAFQGAPYAEKIPIIGVGVKASERAYIGYLNKLRWDLFNMYTDAFETRGKTYENNPKLYEGLSSFINSETGRGGIGIKALENASPVLNWFLFASKLIASRLNMLGLTDIPNLALRGATFGKYGIDYGFYTKLPPELRIEAAKDMLKFLGIGMATIALIKLLGADVENDPRSSDFGKIRIGNTRWDIWGGFQPYARVLTQVLAGQRKATTTGKIYELNGKGFMGQTRISPLVSFGRQKLAPVPSSIIDLASGYDASGQPVTISNELLSSVTPLLFNDIYKGMQDQGVKAIFTVGIPSAFGIGVQTFEANKKNKGNGGGGGAKGSFKTNRKSSKTASKKL